MRERNGVRARGGTGKAGIERMNERGVGMADEIRTIGVLTSGGDAPGMNAAIRAVVRQALAKE